MQASVRPAAPANSPAETRESAARHTASPRASAQSFASISFPCEARVAPSVSRMLNLRERPWKGSTLMATKTEAMPSRAGPSASKSSAAEARCSSRHMQSTITACRAHMGAAMKRSWPRTISGAPILRSGLRERHAARLRAAVSARCSARGAGDGIEPSSALSLRSSFLLICGSFHSDFLRAFSAECSRDCTVRSGSSRTSAISRSFSSWT